jgi:hypothetical protein
LGERRGGGKTEEGRGMKGIGDEREGAVMMTERVRRER